MPAAHSPSNLSAVPIPQLNIAALTYVWSGQQGVNGEAVVAQTCRACEALLFLPLRASCSPPHCHPPPAGDVSNYASQLYSPLAYRPASALEASPDLRQPHFSNCSVPLVMW